MSMRVTISVATKQDREAIYRIRHQVYAAELGQHAENVDERLTDGLDEVNVYLVARCGDALAGFVAITPPGPHGYSFDKYYARDSLPFECGPHLYEVRLLTIVPAHRGRHLAFLLMYGALRYVESSGGTAIAAIGRLEILDLYRRAGLQCLGQRTRSGQVTYELMFAPVGGLKAQLATFRTRMSRLERVVDWQMGGVPFRQAEACYHGGRFFDAIGDEFETLDRAAAVISADVLDAWFDPAPSVVRALVDHLPFALKTSPPTNSDGMRRAIARARGVPENHILPGAGSSDLIFAGLRHWVRASSRVLILDPMYGEYAHVLEKVIGARVDRLSLSRERDYDVDLDELRARLARGYDWVILVNPNSPTGRHVPRERLETALASAPSATRVWLDETYVDYAGEGQSLEAFAAASANVVVCKSMSKAYALSGVRAAYLCGPVRLIAGLRPICPPWSVSLPGQMAACEALKAIDYYRGRWEETRVLRDELATGLRALGWDLVSGCANFLLCHLPPHGPDAATVVERARASGLFVRDVGSMGACFDTRVIRVAVKDSRTNCAMLERLEATLAALAQGDAHLAA
jgi:histidinol-phosphate/aromatic aminotransferase/cobyric acid decarboxylase-like protein